MKSSTSGIDLSLATRPFIARTYVCSRQFKSNKPVKSSPPKSASLSGADQSAFRCHLSFDSWRGALSRHSTSAYLSCHTNFDFARKMTHSPAGLPQKKTSRGGRLSTLRIQALEGTPVPKNSILVVGGTGTLGRQVVRRALDEGYEVRCIVRPRQNPADFLRDWGATTVQADLNDPTSLPAALVGIHTVIDCSTARPEESTQKIDWEGKVALIQCAQAMGIQRYVFFSIHNCDKHQDVPLMRIKTATEKFLQQSGLKYTTLRLCGFMQALIGNYAVPILDEKQVWGTSDETRTAYLDSLDVARMSLAALRSEKTVGQTLTLAGPKAWSVAEVIELCEKLAGSEADVTNVPVWLLKATRRALRNFQWARDAADRLAFSDILASNETFSAPMDETYQILGIDPASVTTLDSYLQEYYTSILKKLKEVGAQSKQTDFYV